MIFSYIFWYIYKMSFKICYILLYIKKIILKKTFKILSIFMSIDVIYLLLVWVWFGSKFLNQVQFGVRVLIKVQVWVFNIGLWSAWIKVKPRRNPSVGNTRLVRPFSTYCHVSMANGYRSRKGGQICHLYLLKL